MRRNSAQTEETAASALLLDWFSRHARALPWRKDYDPYKILVSEFMLQQTQVDTVLPYFEKWMGLYPDLASLAKADERDVKKLWEGLGYYSRCRNLLMAAREMAEAGYTVPPPSAEALSKYPGIGPYTSGAIASIAYNLPVPAVDGNAERVVARFFDVAAAAGSLPLRRVAKEKISSMMPDGKARLFNQALMELGSLVCLPKNPSCPHCPWGTRCLARKHGPQSSRPRPTSRPAAEKIRAWGVLFLIDGMCLLRRRPDRGLWAGFWEIPWFPRETENALAEIGAWGQKMGVPCKACEEIGMARFSFTHHRVTAWFTTCETKLTSCLREKISAGEWGLHKPEDLSDLPLPAPSRKFLRLLETRPTFWEVPHV